MVVKWPPDLQLVPLTRYGPNLANLDDWELLEELHRRGDASGLVTIDGRMLNQPKEMVTLTHTLLTLIVTDGAGNNALRATGLLLVHLPAVLVHPAAPPRIFELRPGNLVPSSASKRINTLAAQRHSTPPTLIEDATREMERLRGG